MKKIFSIALSVMLLVCTFTGLAVPAFADEETPEPAFVLIDTGTGVIDATTKEQYSATYGDHVFLLNVAVGNESVDRSAYDVVYYATSDEADDSDASIHPLKATSLGFGPSDDAMTNLIFIGVNESTTSDQITELKSLSDGNCYVFVIGPSAAEETAKTVDGITAFIATDKSNSDEEGKPVTAFVMSADGVLSKTGLDLPEGAIVPTIAEPAINIDEVVGAVNAYAESTGAAIATGDSSGAIDYEGSDQQELIGAGTALVDELIARGQEQGGTLSAFSCTVTASDGVYHMDASYSYNIPQSQDTPDGDAVIDDTSPAPDEVLDEGQPEADPAAGGDDDEAESQATPNPALSLVPITMSESMPGSDSNVNVGDSVSYSITWANNKESASNVKVSAIVSPYLTISGADVEGGQLSVADNTITWDLGEKQSGETGTITVEAKVNGAINKRVDGLDANQDGVINAEDVDLVQKYVTLQISELPINVSLCDLNGDNQLDASDAAIFSKHVSGDIDMTALERNVSSHAIISLGDSDPITSANCINVAESTALPTQDPEPIATPIAPTETPTATQEPVATQEPTSTPEPVATPEPTAVPVPTATPTPPVDVIPNIQPTEVPDNQQGNENTPPQMNTPTPPPTTDAGMVNPNEIRYWRVKSNSLLQVSYTYGVVDSVSVSNINGAVTRLTQYNEYTLSEDGHTITFSNSYLDSLAPSTYGVIVTFKNGANGETYYASNFNLLVEAEEIQPTATPIPASNPIDQSWDRMSDLTLQLDRTPTGLEIKYSDTNWKATQKDSAFFVNGNTMTIKADLFNGKLNMNAWPKGTYTFRITYADAQPQLLRLTLTTDPPATDVTPVPTATPVPGTEGYVDPYASPSPTPLPGERAPVTGDTTNIWLYVVILVVLLGGLCTAGIIYYRKKKTR